MLTFLVASAFSNKSGGGGGWHGLVRKAVSCRSSARPRVRERGTCTSGITGRSFGRHPRHVGVRRLRSGVRRDQLGEHPGGVGVRRRESDGRRSDAGVRRSHFGVRRSDFGERRGGIGVRRGDVGSGEIAGFIGGAAGGRGGRGFIGLSGGWERVGWGRRGRPVRIFRRVPRFGTPSRGTRRQLPAPGGVAA